MSSTVACQPYGEFLVVGRLPDGVVHMESRVRPREHALSCLDIHQLAFDEQLENRAAEGLGERGDFVEGQVEERAVRTEAAVGDKQVQMRMPVGERSVGLDR